jgi:hypothetical protein
MKRLFAGLAMAGLLVGTGCTTYTAMAQGPSADKVYITKNTNYLLLWKVNKMELCNFSGTKATGCVEVTEE